MTSKSKRRSIALGIFLVLAITAGGAYAYWTNSGTGTGTAATANPPAGQLTVSGNAITGLAPGATAQTLTGTINNTGTSDVRISTLSATISIDTAHATAGCAASDYTLVQPSITASNIAAGGNTTFSSGTIAFNNKATNQDFCKGATVTLNYTVG